MIPVLLLTNLYFTSSEMGCNVSSPPNRDCKKVSIKKMLNKMRKIISNNALLFY